MEKFLVGGAVRDLLLQRQPKDRDYVVIGATFEEMKALYGDPVGGTFPVFLDKAERAEVAMARKEKKAGRGYKGFAVEFGPEVTLEEDLERRDLTINAMAMSKWGVIVDPFGGRKDLGRGILRHVSAAFAEDPLRVFRLARFAAQFGFSVAPETIVLARRLRNELSALPIDRVTAEMLKALAAPAPQRFFEVLREVEALDVVFPEIAALEQVPAGPTKHHAEGNGFVHTMMVLQASAGLSSDPLVRFGALVHDLGKAITDPALLPRHHGHEETGVPLVDAMGKRLKGLPREFVRVGRKTAAEHLRVHRACEAKPSSLHDLIARLQSGDANDLRRVCEASEADARGRFPSTSSADAIGRIYRAAETMMRIRAQDVIREGDVGPKIGERLRMARIDAIRDIACAGGPREIV